LRIGEEKRRKGELKRVESEEMGIWWRNWFMLISYIEKL
jgi:hypothetical protein